MLDQDLEYAELVYVGKRAFKADNVANSGVVWFGYGDCKKVPKKLYPIFAKHPDVWLLKEDFKPQASTAVVAQVSSQVASIGMAASSNVIQIATGGQAESENGGSGLADAQKGQGDTGANAQDNSSDDQNSSSNEDENNSEDDTSSDDKDDARQQVIIAAILALETGNPSHFSKQTGNPIIAAVRNAAGDETISTKEVNAAWKVLSANN